jgi:hypothetical protein
MNGLMRLRLSEKNLAVKRRKSTYYLCTEGPHRHPTASQPAAFAPFAPQSITVKNVRLPRKYRPIDNVALAFFLNLTVRNVVVRGRIDARRKDGRLSADLKTSLGWGVWISHRRSGWLIMCAHENGSQLDFAYRTADEVHRHIDAICDTLHASAVLSYSLPRCGKHTGKALPGMPYTR